MPPRKTSELPTRIWQYGIYSHQCEVEGRPLVEQQMLRTHRYQNRLNEIDRGRRRRVDDVMSRHPEIHALEQRIKPLEQELEQLRDAIKTARSQARGRVKADPSIQQRIEEIKQALGRRSNDKLGTKGFGLREDLKLARARLFASHETDSVQEWFNQEVKAARGSDEAPEWGSYLLVDDAWKHAWKHPPRDFRSFDRCGRIGVQIQSSSTNPGKGLTTETLLACRDSRARLELDPKNPREAKLWLRCGSDAKRQPLWAKFPLKYHRPLPKGALIKWVWCQRSVHDAKGRWGHPDDARVWTCCFVLEHKSFAFKPRAGGHMAAINLGFRKLDDDMLRVAYVVGTNGSSRQITCQGIMSSLDHADGRHSKRDRGFNVAKEQLKIWLRDHGDLAPPWLIGWTSSESLEETTSVRRLEKLVEKWSKQRNRFTGDHEIYETMLAWSRQIDQSQGFEAARNQLVQWIRDNSVPSWLKERSARSTIGQWRSLQRLDRLVGYWRQNRFEGDQEIYGELYRWAQEDRHGRQHEGGIRMKTYGRRKAHYRNEATELCRQFTVIRILTENLAELKRKPRPEAGESELERVQRRQFNVAAQGEFMAALRLAASNQGTQLIEVPAKMSSGRGVSETHHLCGRLHAQDRRQSVMIVCPHCNLEFDQDENAARNMLNMRLDAEAAQ